MMSVKSLILILGQMALLCALCAYLFATSHPVAGSFALVGVLTLIHTVGRAKPDKPETTP